MLAYPQGNEQVEVNNKTILTTLKKKKKVEDLEN